MKKILVLLIEIIGIYICCVFFAFINAKLLSKAEIFLPILLISPIITLGLTLLVFYQKLKYFFYLVLLTIITLSLKSDLMGLYLKACEVKYNHTSTTGIITFLLMLITVYILFKLCLKKVITINHILIVILSALVFEIAATTQYLNLLAFLYYWF